MNGKYWTETEKTLLRALYEGGTPGRLIAIAIKSVSRRALTHVGINVAAKRHAAPRTGQFIADRHKIRGLKADERQEFTDTERGLINKAKAEFVAQTSYREVKAPQGRPKKDRGNVPSLMDWPASLSFSDQNLRVDDRRGYMPSRPATPVFAEARS